MQLCRCWQPTAWSPESGTVSATKIWAWWSVGRICPEPDKAQRINLSDLQNDLSSGTADGPSCTCFCLSSGKDLTKAKCLNISITQPCCFLMDNLRRLLPWLQAICFPSRSHYGSLICHLVEAITSRHLQPHKYIWIQPVSPEDVRPSQSSLSWAAQYAPGGGHFLTLRMLICRHSSFRATSSVL